MEMQTASRPLAPGWIRVLGVGFCDCSELRMDEWVQYSRISSGLLVDSRREIGMDSFPWCFWRRGRHALVAEFISPKKCTLSVL